MLATKSMQGLHIIRLSYVSAKAFVPNTLYLMHIATRKFKMTLKTLFSGAILRAHLDRQPTADVQGRVRHGLLQPLGALQEVPLHQHRLP